MSYKIIIDEYANHEIVEAYLYYEEKRVGLGEEFLNHLDNYFAKISTHPTRFPQKRKLYREAYIKDSHI